jgi:hypothetical protein
MAEFAGYIGSQVPPTDWSKITRDYTDKLITLNEQRKAEQEKIDDMEAEAYAKVGDIESTSSEPFNNFMLDTVDNYRQAIAMKAKLLKQGLVSSKEFKKTVLTATTQTGVMNRFAKTYQEQATMLTKAAAEDKLGKYGVKLAEKFGSFQSIGNRKSLVDPDTAGLFIADIDPETKTVKSKNNISSILTIANPANSFVPKVDLASTTKGIKDLLGSKGLIVNDPDGSSYVSDSAKNNPEYETIINSQASALTSTPNQVVNILSDYGGYETYFNEQEKKELLNKGMKEDKLIFISQRDNLYVPVLDDTQKKAARDIVAKNIKGSLSEKITSRQAAPKPDKPTESESGRKNLLARSTEIWRDIRNPTTPQLTQQAEFEIKQALGLSGIQDTKIKKIFDNGNFVGINVYPSGTNFDKNTGKADQSPALTFNSKSELTKFLALDPTDALSGSKSVRQATEEAKKEGKYYTYSQLKTDYDYYKSTGKIPSGVTFDNYKNMLEDQSGIFVDEDK